MPGKGTEKHYAGRYICQKPRSKCKGEFKQCGEWKPCPLRRACLACEDEQGQLERFWPFGKYGKLLIQSEPGWNRKHSDKLRELKWAFVPEVMKTYYGQYLQENRDRIQQNRRIWEGLRKAMEKPEVVTEPDRGDQTAEFGQGARHLLLPCGEDCRNCPLPGGPAECPYTDEDEDRLMELEYGR